MISFKKNKTTLNREQYESELNEVKCMLVNDYRKTKIFITNENSINGYAVLDIEIYFKDNYYLQIQYPEKDMKAKEELFNVLTNIKIKRI